MGRHGLVLFDGKHPAVLNHSARLVILDRSRIFEIAVTMFGNAVAVTIAPIPTTTKTSRSENPARLLLVI